MIKKMKIVVDGNDGTGKSTLVEKLKQAGYEVQDRGIPTKLTDNPHLEPEPNEFYLILDAPVEICQERLKKAGRDLNQKYHTIEDLTYYRKRFLEVAKQLKNQCVLIDATKSIEEVYKEALKWIKKVTKKSTP